MYSHGTVCELAYQTQEEAKISSCDLQYSRPRRTGHNIQFRRLTSAQSESECPQVECRLGLVQKVCHSNLQTVVSWIHSVKEEEIMVHCQEHEGFKCTVLLVLTKILIRFSTPGNC